MSKYDDVLNAAKEMGIVIPNSCPKLEDLTKATGRMDRINPLTGMKEADPVTGETEIPKLVLSPSKACKVITDYMALRIASDDGRENPKLWRCNGKIWKPDGDRQVVNLIDAVLGDLSYDRGLKETLRRIRGVSDTVTFDSSPYLFPALDKVIDLKTGLIRDYQPEDYLTYQYGAAVEDPSADCRPVLWSLCSSAQDPRDVLTALDIATAACIRQPLDAIIQLIGPGANGKGIFERILTALCTASRVAAITLAEAKSSRFGPGAVLGKDIWILSEVEDVSLAINLLKKVATGELMDSDVKYSPERAQGKPHVLPILDCNTAINFGDDSWGRKRRIIKLDYPHTFDYIPGTRRKDPHLKEKVTTPSALAGLLRIIAARAPFLCESRRIYSRKRPEDMAEEYKRQQDSLKYFCEDCLTTEPMQNAEGRPIDMTTGQPWPGGVIGKLTTDALYTEYMTYCKLLNVPIPAEKSPFGKYINATFGVISVSTTQKGASIRYYPGLMLAKTARLAFAELSYNYTNYNTTTGELQEGIEERDLLSLLTTATTGEWPKDVIDEIVKMFCFIESCENPQEISYKGYVAKTQFSCRPVVKGDVRPDEDESPVVFPSLSCSFEHTEAEQCRAQDAHFKDVAEKYTGKPDQTDLQMGLDQVGDLNGGGKEAAPSPAPKEDPDRAKFKAKVQTRGRNTCRLCGEHFEIPLQMGCKGGFMCSKCHREGAPSAPTKADSQMKLEEVPV